MVTDGRSFAQAHDAFTTTLVREENDDYEIPAPPEGLFDLVSYPSKVGDLAAYVSSDPGDGEKHPMIIWVAAGATALTIFPGAIRHGTTIRPVRPSGRAEF